LCAWQRKPLNMYMCVCDLILDSQLLLLVDREVIEKKELGMEKNGFPLSSTSALGTSLQLLIRVLFLLKVDMLCCVAINGAPLYWTSLRGIYSGCLSPGSSWGAVKVSLFK
jgi:hypothetical protein